MSDVKAPRQAWVDLAKGIGIILVVMGHALGGMIDSDYGSQIPWMRTLFLSIYTFHMPLFFFLSGLFIAERVKKDPRKFTTNMFAKLARPYFTWSIIQFSVLTLMSGMLNHPITEPFIPRMIALLWKPASQFWFLYFLFFLQFAALIIVPRLGAVAFLIIAVVLRVISYVADPYVTGDPRIVLDIFRFSLDFGIGVAVGPVMGKLSLLKKPQPLVLLAAVPAAAASLYGAYLFVSMTQKPDWLMTLGAAAIATLSGAIAFYPTALLATLVVVLICAGKYLPLPKVFEYLGQNSMPIYLTHILCVAGSRILLMKAFKTIDINLLFVLNVAIGLIVPLIFFEIAKRLKLAKLLALS